jgi:signal transduction histidine kinase
MQDEDRRALRVIVAFAIVVSAFVTSTVMVNLRTIAIERRTDDLLGNAIPSIRFLHDAESAVRHIEVDVDGYIDLARDERPAVRKAIEDHWRAIDEDFTRYHELPSFTGEQALFLEVPGQQRVFDGRVRARLAEVDANAAMTAEAEANRALRESTAAFTKSIEAIAEFNVARAVDAAKQINDSRRVSVMTSMVVDAIAALLTVLLARWLVGALRTHDRLQIEHQRLIERRASELEMFGVRVAHDLLSPLSSLTYCLTAFKKASREDEALARATDRARICVERARELVDGIFDFARSGGAPNFDARASVVEAVEQIVADVRAEAPSERVEIEVGPLPSCSVTCPRGVLASLLANLVRNAVKFMSDAVVRKVAIRVEERADDVRFEIEDTGSGIDASLVRSIFEPYSRGEGVTQPGLGLGLATVKRFCTAYGGTVGVRTEVGRGSVFSFTLPKAKGAPTPRAFADDPASLRRLRDSEERATEGDPA